MDRAAEEQRSTFCYTADAAELCSMSYVRATYVTSHLKKTGTYEYEFYSSKNIHGESTRDGKFMRLEPHFQISATRSGWKVTETVVASPHSRECTKEPMSPLRNIGPMEKFEARAE